MGSNTNFGGKIIDLVNTNIYPRSPKTMKKVGVFTKDCFLVGILLIIQVLLVMMYTSFFKVTF